MNCFGWQNRSSDYLDGALIGNVKREADEHLEQCEPCNTRYKHYRLVLTSIASQPRNSLPVAIRKAPLSTGHSKRIHLRARLGLWSVAPWYIRIPAEGAGIVLLVALAISAGPRLRTLYERKVERSLTEYSDGFGASDSDLENYAGLGRGNVAATDPAAGAPLAPGQVTTPVNNDDFSGSEAGSADSAEEAAGDRSEDAADDAVRVGAAETWRFNLKTDSPHDVRMKIVKILTELKVPATTPGIGGIEAPGGIQFDLLVPQTVVSDLKQALEKTAPPAPKELADSPFGETFTWYKNKSKRALPAGQTHVVIWLSQI